MKLHLPLIALFFAGALLSCNDKPKGKITALGSSKLNLSAIADKTMGLIKLTPGEKVFIIGKPGEFDSLIVLLSDKITASGGTFLGVINVDDKDSTSWPASWSTEFTKSVKGKSKEEHIKLYDGIDLGIMLPGPGTTHVPYSAWQEVLRSGKGRAVHLHWAGADDMSGADIEVDSTIALLYQQAILDLDYEEIATKQNEFEEAIRKSGVVVTTPSGTNLSFRIGDRSVTKKDGDGSKAGNDKKTTLMDREVELPAGAIRVAPIEETVEGTMAFPPSMWGDQKVEGLIITFKKGKITDIKAKEGLEFVKAKIAPGVDGYIFCDFGLGFNPILSITESNQRILNYGYGAGTVRLSLGNNSELGGKVGGEFKRITTVTDATVMTGGEVWVRDGKLVK